VESHRRTAILTFIILTTVSCARSTGIAAKATGETLRSATPTPSAQYDVMQIDWNNPIEGEPVTSVALAQQNLAFTVQVPQGLPTSASIFVSPLAVSIDGRALAFVYVDPQYGQIDVVEHVPPATGEAYDAMHADMVALNGQPETHGSFELVSLVSGQEALLTVSEDGQHATMFWLNGDAEIVLEGPSLLPDQAVDIANKL
jgi:hypothetical protein